MPHVLVIDDDPVNIRILYYWLGDAGYTITAVSAPRAALAVIAQAAYDLIVLDLMLPEMNGIDLCQAIRRISPTPILVLSAADAATHRARALQAGADAYLAKPFQPAGLLHTDVDLTAQPIVEWFVWRWQLEVTLEEARAHLCIETQRQWAEKAIALTTPALLGCSRW